VRCNLGYQETWRGL